MFQALPHPLGVGSEVWRVVAKCHDCHHVAEYEGYVEYGWTITESLVNCYTNFIASRKLSKMILVEFFDKQTLKFTAKKEEMIKKVLVFCIIILNIPQAISAGIVLQSKHIQEKVKSLSEVGKISTKVSKEVLPAPYNYLLTQPLMTKGIETYYQRTPFIQTIYATKNHHNNTYSRAIVMRVDNNKARNNVTLAIRKKETMVVELAFITMNFEELPPKIINNVINTNVPFGKLLSNNHVKISTKDRTYFWITCDQVLASLTDCHLNNKLYGRTNTIIKANNNQWLAHVVEILAGF